MQEGRAKLTAEGKNGHFEGAASRGIEVPETDG
jgi:hypothetical protein